MIDIHVGDGPGDVSGRNLTFKLPVKGVGRVVEHDGLLRGHGVHHAVGQREQRPVLRRRGRVAKGLIIRLEARA